MSTLPCLLCSSDLEQRTDKHRKPYFICDPCGMQMFVRRAEGAKNLERLIRTLNGQDLPTRAHAQTLLEISAILQELNGVEHEIEKLDRSVGLLAAPSDEKLRARELLKKRLQTLLDHLERIAEGR